MPVKRLKIFISSVQKEFAEQRRELKVYLLGDPFLSQFISEVFLFEDQPAKDIRTDYIYLKEVERCDIYLGVLGNEYGYENQDGKSPTECEYDHATLNNKTRLIYVWGYEDDNRLPKMLKLIRKVGDDLIRRRIGDINGLKSAVYASMVDYLKAKGALNIEPFDAAFCEGATLKNISNDRIKQFLESAQRERGFKLKINTPTKSLLTHLNLIKDNNLCNAALLLFGENPQQFLRTAETKCIHCHSTHYQRPFASQQIYTGDIFRQVDQARDFVLAKINRTVGLRSNGATAPANYELPPDAVSEAIVNAIAHRDYYSNASVEVRLFADRLEIWNPGSLPNGLSIDSLKTDHPSIPNNPLLAESLFLARYIEKAGSGTQTMIELCHKADLPEPTFEQREGFFIVTIWRDWLTDEILAKLELNSRQLSAIKYLKENKKISNSKYQEITKSIKKTASRDLNDLKSKGLIQQIGIRGPGVHYVLARKGDIMGTKGT